MATTTSHVQVQGRYLWKDDERFFVKGVVYQANHSDDFSPGGRDLISDDRLAQLQHDVQLFQELDINTLLIYTIDPTKPHAKAMKLLEQAGIHVFITLATVKHCIHRHNPYGTYNEELLTAFFQSIDAMASFPNVLGVLITEHLINNLDSERCAPVVRAVVRDLKQYMELKRRLCGQRPLPVGFGGGSYKYDRKVVDYMTAGDRDSCVDFWTCTGFQLAGKSIADMRGRDDLIEKYNGVNIPIVISEYGAGDTTKSPRTFAETPTLYSPEMTDVFSGGCVYQFWQGSNSYGLAQFEHNAITYDRRNTPEAGKVAEKRDSDLGTLLLFEDFVNYKAQLAALPQRATSVNERSKEQKNMEAHGPTSWNFEIEGAVPESCVDWLAIEEGWKSQV